MFEQENELEFFLQCPIGLSEICEMELRQKWPRLFPEQPIPRVELISEGLTFATSHKSAVFLNNYLKSVNRILVRLDRFKCRDIPKLFKKAQKYPWNSIIGDSDFELKISCHQSRLFHTARIEKAFRDGIAKYRKANPCPKKWLQASGKIKQRLYLRLDNDTLTLSLDTTGENLYRRSHRTEIGRASLRETLAASLAILAIEEGGQKESIVDPMCGSGQILREFFDFPHPNERDFAYTSLPFFEELDPRNHSSLWQDPPYHFFAYDRDNEMVELAKKRLTLEGVKLQAKRIDFFQNDFAQIPKFSVCVLNPPYGKRIKIPYPPHIFFNKIVDQLKQSECYSHLVAIIPIDFLPLGKKDSRVGRCFKTKNGGIDVFMLSIPLSRS